MKKTKKKMIKPTFCFYWMNDQIKISDTNIVTAMEKMEKIILEKYG